MKRLVIPFSIALLVLQGAHAESQQGNVNKPQVSAEAQTLSNSQMPPMDPWVNKPGMSQKQSAPPSNAPAL